MVTRDDLTRMSEHGDVMFKVVFVRAKDGGPSRPTDGDYAFITGYRAKCLSEYLDTFDPMDKLPELWRKLKLEKTSVKLKGHGEMS